MKPYYEQGGIVIYNADCRDVLPSLARMDLVLTDPPYGIGEDSDKAATRGKLALPKNYGDFHWDSKLDQSTILQVLAAGKHQVIFGGNYYANWLPPSSCWFVWDKDNTGDFADCELAWTSLPKAVRKYRYRWNGMLQEPSTPKEERVHPTHKPVSLMRWCLGFFPEAQTVLDPFMGGGSTLRAAKDVGKQAIGIDISEAYCEIAAKRLAQGVLPL